jgi:hypothetical protein
VSSFFFFFFLMDKQAVGFPQLREIRAWFTQSSVYLTHTFLYAVLMKDHAEYGMRP